MSSAPHASIERIGVADVAIVGAGLCGLVLARGLVAQGRRVALIEARGRLGGRAWSATCAHTGLPLDAGPTWYWPETQPRLVALLDELGLPSLAQHDPGDALWLTDPNRQALRREEPGGVHQGARRIVGGAQALVDALAACLPEGVLWLSHALCAVVGPIPERSDGVELHLAHKGSPRRLRAHCVVLAMPPRLVRERVDFEPALPPGLAQALADTPTWMGAQAKALVSYPRRFWREDGHSGQAFVRHPQAVLGEVFDACGEGGQGAALGGFSALPPALRETFRRGMPMLIESQLAQLYGPAAMQGHLHWFDWAQEPWTCSRADREGPAQAPRGDPVLRQSHWQGRLLFGGSETAAHGTGHMEGALDAAARVLRILTPLGAPRREAHAASDHGALQRHDTAVASLRAAAPAQYRRHVTRLLAAQDSDALTQRALLATVEQAYSGVLDLLESLHPDLPEAGVPVQGRHALTSRLLAPFNGWNQALLQEALAFNGGSCALSNFPHEHRPDAALVRAITLDLAAAWREFALALNARLLTLSAEAPA